MTDDAGWTVMSLLRATQQFLGQRGSQSPRLDAELLLAHALGDGDRMWLYRNADRPVTDEEREACREWVARRAQGEPIAYILGTVEFWSLELGVDARVLVPRPETEHVVSLALAELGAWERADWRIVDVGTGSGALALALAHELPESTVLAVDTSAAALEVARANADRLGLRERVRFVQGDVLSPVAGREGVVDLVVSNPPYVGDEDPELESSVRAHEPSAALFAGRDGLEVIRRLIPDAHRALAPGGALVMEFGARQGAAVLALAREVFAAARIERDFAGHDRVLIAVKEGALGTRRVDAAEVRIDDAESGVEPQQQPSDTEEPEPVGADEDAPDWRARLLAEAEEAGLPIIDMDDL